LIVNAYRVCKGINGIQEEIKQDSLIGGSVWRLYSVVWIMKLYLLLMRFACFD